MVWKSLITKKTASTNLEKWIYVKTIPELQKVYGSTLFVYDLDKFRIHFYLSF